MPHTKNQHTRKALSIQQGYILALSLILFVATMKFVAVESLSVKLDESAVIINVSGKQRMLSQRIAFFSAYYMAEGNEDKRQRIASELSKSADEFKASHKDLIEGNISRDLPQLDNPAILDVYYNQSPPLDDLVTKYVAAAHVILDNEGRGEKAQDALTTIEEIGPSILLTKLNDVVKLHEQNARSDVIFISNLQKLFLLITIMVLLLEGLFLFRPMERKIKDNITQLQKREAKIKEQFLELERFTYIASHDLQEPLRKIIGFTERLEASLKNKLKDKEKTYINFILQGAVHMRDLIQGLHAYARISATEDNLEEVDAEKALQQALKELQHEIENQNAKIKCHPLPKVIYNKVMLAQLFENLICNAIKYKGAQTPVINIKALDQDSEWVFCIEDNGLGINEKFFERVFVIFQRLHRKEDIAGTGLGLAIAKQIVERHGGKIWIKSKEGEGSQFYFSVPKDI